VQTVAVDIGGTYARFAVAEVAGGRVTTMHNPITMKVSEHASFQLAWQAFAEEVGKPVPRAAAIAMACPIDGDVLKLTNNPWIIRPALIPEKLNVEAWTLVNDFGAIAHAVTQLDAKQLVLVGGPDRPLPDDGVISVIGPGTGLGVAQILRRNGQYHVMECEGGHIDFAPLDSLEDEILRYLRQRHNRVSVERVISGPGLTNIYEALVSVEGMTVEAIENTKLWELAVNNKDSLAAAALDRFCLSLGSVAGDIALAQGAKSVVIAGGIAPRIAHFLSRSGFIERFVAKGRFARMMNEIPIRLITHPQPGLYGAAAAFAHKYTAKNHSQSG